MDPDVEPRPVAQPLDRVVQGRRRFATTLQAVTIPSSWACRAPRVMPGWRPTSSAVTTSVLNGSGVGGASTGSDAAGVSCRAGWPRRRGWRISG